MISRLWFRSHAISATTQLYAALRFYATGSFFLTAADLIGISEPAVCYIVLRVSKAIASLKNEYIKFPDSPEERKEVHEEFYRIGPGFPTVLGAIDCTHVRIAGPGGSHGEIYRNRKHFFSINVQSVSGPRLEFYDIVARWPGSTHDSFIFNQSSLKERLERGDFGNIVIVGDGGYAVEKYMMTPYRNPTTQAEKHFNKIQSKTRNPVERKYGVWKRRFPCLALTLRCQIPKTLIIIVACAVLHNFCIQHNVPDAPNDMNGIEDAIAYTEITDSMIAPSTSSTQSEIMRARNRRDAFANQIFNAL